MCLKRKEDCQSDISIRLSLVELFENFLFHFGDQILQANIAFNSHTTYKKHNTLRQLVK